MLPWGAPGPSKWRPRVPEMASWDAKMKPMSSKMRPENAKMGSPSVNMDAPPHTHRRFSVQSGIGSPTDE